MSRGNGNAARTSERRITVLVVDGHPTTRFGIGRAIEEEEDMLVVGEAGDTDDALRLAQETMPSVIVVDPVLGGEAGMRLLRELKCLTRPPRPRGAHCPQL